jgi:hypothetical protein
LRQCSRPQVSSPYGGRAGIVLNCASTTRGPSSLCPWTSTSGNPRHLRRWSWMCESAEYNRMSFPRFCLKTARSSALCTNTPSRTQRRDGRHWGSLLPHGMRTIPRETRPRQRSLPYALLRRKERLSYIRDRRSPRMMPAGTQWPSNVEELQALLIPAVVRYSASLA